MGRRRLVAVIVALACVSGYATAAATAQETAPSDGAGAGVDAPTLKDPATRIDRQLATSRENRLTDSYPPPDVTASGWLVYDDTADEAVAGVESATPRPIASLAKLMTALVVLEELELDDTVTIPPSVNDLPADAARMDARAGEEWAVRDLLRAMLAHSANDAALALAEHVGEGDEAAFVRRMNEHAQKLGLRDTEFASATGLDAPGRSSTSTPIDLVTLTQAVLANADAAAAVAAEQVTLQRPGGGDPIELPNRNPLLGSYPGVDGVKTGFTDAAGYMLVVHHLDEVTGAELILVTFASRSERARTADARALLDWARPLRTQVRVVEGGMPLGSIPVQRSRERLEVFACDDLVVSARVGQRLVQKVVVPRSVIAPISEGDEVGELRVLLGAPDSADSPLPETVPVCSGTTLVQRSRLERIEDHARDWRGAWRTGIDEVEDSLASLRERLA